MLKILRPFWNTASCFLNSLTAIRVLAGTKNRNSTESTVDHKHNNHKHHQHGGAVCPSYGLGSMDTPDWTRVTSSEGVGRGVNCSFISYYIIYYVKDSTAIATTMLPLEIRCEAHRPMEHIDGFMRSHSMPPSGVCSRRIGPADAMVIAVAVV
jgi:hypothetical protein